MLERLNHGFCGPPLRSQRSPVSCFPSRLQPRARSDPHRKAGTLSVLPDRIPLNHFKGLSLTDADLKRELISRQVQSEISELNSPTALRRFGAPFKSEFGEVAPVDSELPILRYIFVHHVRNFPFLDQAREKEFWQDKLQVVRVPPTRPVLRIP